MAVSCMIWDNPSEVYGKSVWDHVGFLFFVGLLKHVEITRYIIHYILIKTKHYTVKFNRGIGLS